MDEPTENLNQALLEAMDTYARRTCFHLKRGKRFRAISYQHFQTLTFRLTNFLHTHGITNGERIAIIADNPLEWMVVYVASLLSGNVPVPLRAWLPPDMLRAMVKDSGACLAVIQGEGQRWLIEAARQGLPECETVLVVNEIDTPRPWVLPIATILAKSTTSKEDEKIHDLAAGVKGHALASIYYKTGQPRGIVFSHAQRLAAVHSMADWFTLNEDDVAITTILAWSLASLDAALHYFLSGVPHIVAESGDLTQNQQATPTVILTTPSGFEEFYNIIMAEIQELPSARQALFQWAMTVGREYREAGLAASEELRQAYARADLTFFSPIRARSGGRLYRIYSTGAPLPQKWAEFTEIIGTLPLNVYSLTEAGGFPATSRPEARRPGSCGQVAPGFQIRIADDGEVLVRGRAVMKEYWQRPEETRQVLDEDGWIHTGDLGRFDRDGYLYLTGHKQPQIVLSTGRNVTPGAIENALTASPYISQAVLFGEGRNYIAALITPDLAAVTSQLQEAETGSSAPLSVEHPQVKALIAEAVTEVNNRLDSWTEVKEYHLLADPLCQQAGELTSSQKPCRDVVAERYAAEIEALYPRTIQFEQKDLSHVQFNGLARGRSGHNLPPPG
jgi:long-chain acyl-CoA synthetase